MDSGYVRLWRKCIETGWLKNKNAWIFWTWCLMKANHRKDFKQVVGFQEIILQPGDFIFGLNKASEETFLSIQNIRTCLKFLEKSKNLTIKTTNKFSILSITNWDTYQYSEETTNTQTNKQLTNNQQTTNNKQEQLNKRTIIDSGKSALDFFAPEINGWDKTLIESAIDGIISTRKSNQVTSGVIESEISYWRGYPDAIVNNALGIYVKGEYWKKTKGEKYLRGIIRGKAAESEKSNSQTILQKAF